MNDQEIRELKKGIVLTAAYYGRDLKPEVVAMMADDLKDLEFKKVSEAYRTYRLDEKNRTMPMPAQIRAIVKPSISPESEARAIVDRIKFAISKFGYMQSEAAKEFIGSIGWNAVRAQGGWFNVCSSDFVTNTAMIAQIRQSTLDQVQHGETKFGSNLIQLEPRKSPELIESQKNSEEKKRQASELIEMMKKTNA